jgi:hypothetical protein
VFAGIVRFRGADSPAAARPGDTVRLATLWEVVGEAPPDLVLFTHLLDADGEPVAQADRLDVPSEQWQSGDLFVQLHEVIVPSELASGVYQLTTGLYPAADWRQRLPLSTGGEAAGDTLVLPPLEVRP